MYHKPGGPTILNSSAVVAGILAGVHILLGSSFRSGEEILPQWLLVGLNVVDKIAAATACVLACWWALQRGLNFTEQIKSQLHQSLRWIALGCIGIVVFPVNYELSFHNSILYHLTSTTVIVVAGYALIFLLRVFSSYRTQYTTLLLQSAGVIVSGIVVAGWIDYILGSGISNVVRVFGCLSIVILTIQLGRRRRWIRYMTLHERRNVLWWGIVAMVSTSICTILSFDRQESLAIYFESWLVGSHDIAGSIFLAVAVYSFLLISSLLARTNEAKRTISYEYDALTFFNRIAVEAHQAQKLYDTITAIAIGLTRGTGACLFIAEHNDFRLASLAGVREDQVAMLEIERIIGSNPLHDSIVIPFLRDDMQLYRIARSVESYAQSLMIIPLRSGPQYHGFMLILSNRAYAFEYDDAQMLHPFLPSIILALTNQHLIQQSIEHERLQRELAIGREIQRKLLPDSIPILNGWEVAGLYEPAYEVGGDYYDYFQLANGIACVLIADVSGKGIGAAFYMAKLKGVCTALAPLCNDIHCFVVQVHRALEHVLESGVFITLAAVGIDTTGQISIVRAGHPPLLGFTNAGLATQILPSGIGIGLIGTDQFATITQMATFTQSEYPYLMMYTDGLTEAGFYVGRDVDEKTINRLAWKYLTTSRLNDQLHYFRMDFQSMTGIEQLGDDITIVLLRYKDAWRCTQ